MAVVIVTGEASEGFWADLAFESEGVRFTYVEGLEQYDGLEAGSSPDVLVIDLDQVPLDDRQVRNIKRRHPEIELLIVSCRPAHPELRGSLERHIFACLSKPLDEEEFGFCLKSIWEKKSAAAPDS